MNSFNAILIGTAVLFGTAVSAWSQETPAYPAGIYEGGCGQRGELVADLAPAVVPSGETVGSAEDVTAAQSRSSLDLGLSDLVAGGAALFVGDPAESEADPACGVLGDVIDASGALVVGLFPVDGSGVSGIAYLGPSATGTDVSLFVAAGEEEAQSGAAAEATAATTPRATSTLRPTSTPRPARTPTPAPVRGDAIDQVMATTEAEVSNVLATAQSQASAEYPELSDEIDALMPTVQAEADAMLPTVEAEARNILVTIEAGGQP